MLIVLLNKTFPFLFQDVAQPTTPSQTPTQKLPMKKVLSGGTIMEEVKIGHGPEAKEGKVVCRL